MKVRIDDGTKVEGGPRDTAVIPSGHDAWVVGDESCISIDFTGMKNLLREHKWIVCLRLPFYFYNNPNSRELSVGF